MTKLKTRSQSQLALAEKLLSEVESLKNAELSHIYGGLCHSFPVFVMTCGLCQALAFSAAKAVGDDPRAKAHQLLLKHVGKMLDIGDDPLPAVRDDSVTEYMLYTRRVLSAWIYFKRFAESILKVKAGEENRDGG